MLDPKHRRKQEGNLRQLCLIFPLSSLDSDCVLSVAKLLVIAVVL
jgi:hypothetical protein